MRGKRLKLEQTPDESKRNAVFRKRVESLTKKADELSVLCGVDMGMVIHKPGENNAILWPSPEMFGARLEKFMDFPDSERARKLMVQEKYLEQKLQDETDNVLKLRHKIECRSYEQRINEMMYSRNLNEFDLVQLNSLQCFAVEMLQKLQRRDMELKSDEEMSKDITTNPPAGGATGGGCE
ncbi:hypothetical protein BUALT_Bualt14G0014900 [Buddleja alternifolia]|uniref:MADS-box domain-containing protein n=1 Tax=Buddleja alternifolia TaxID=168488 RepID=A0AAV6WFD7_9LAMI|nr:hypothetical protein BUALT_Bualt14G0014900 [Buddleja alternifolia]